jgi:hypothetical protein
MFVRFLLSSDIPLPPSKGDSAHCPPLKGVGGMWLALLLPDCFVPRNDASRCCLHGVPRLYNAPHFIARAVARSNLLKIALLVRLLRRRASSSQ